MNAKALVTLSNQQSRDRLERFNNLPPLTHVCLESKESTARVFCSKHKKWIRPQTALEQPLSKEKPLQVAAPFEERRASLRNATISFEREGCLTPTTLEDPHFNNFNIQVECDEVRRCLREKDQITERQLKLK